MEIIVNIEHWILEFQEIENKEEKKVFLKEFLDQDENLESISDAFKRLIESCDEQDYKSIKFLLEEVPPEIKNHLFELKVEEDSDEANALIFLMYAYNNLEDEEQQEVIMKTIKLLIDHDYDTNYVDKGGESIYSYNNKEVLEYISKRAFLKACEK